MYYPYGWLVLLVFSIIVLPIGFVGIYRQRDRRSGDRFGECIALFCVVALLNLVPALVHYDG